MNEARESATAADTPAAPARAEMVARDPLVAAHHSARKGAVAGAVVVFAAAIWALWPVHPRPLIARGAVNTEAPDTATIPAPPLDVAAFDAAAFRAVLGVPLTEEVLPPPPPPHLALELLAITTVPGARGYRASAYDLASNSVILLTTGDTADGWVVVAVTASTLVLRRDTAERTLSLRPAEMEGGDSP